MSWNDLEICRRSLEMKAAASMFAAAQRKGDLQEMKKWNDAMQRTVEMVDERLKELGCE